MEHQKLVIAMSEVALAELALVPASDFAAVAGALQRGQLAGAQKSMEAEQLRLRGLQKYEAELMGEIADLESDT